MVTVSHTLPLGTWQSLARLIRLSNQSGTLLLMLPTLWALVLASEGRPSVSLLIIFTVGSFLMRSAGVVMNDLSDRSIDRHVERTRSRPLASGAVTVPQAVVLLAGLLAAAAGLLLLLNPLVILLSPIALLLAAVYPLTKRIFPLPQAMLGMAFGWGVVMAWASVKNTVNVSVWALYGATICWAIAYDTIYALQDRDDDLRLGVKSAAILFGTRAWVAVAGCLIAMLMLLGIEGWRAGLNGAFYGLLAGIGGFLSQQVMRLRKPLAPADAFRLFKQHVWVGWAILAAIWIGFL
ncbi:4-hydroxybenzoate octaprenyltransferase [Candidatus Nitrospira bockiana]